MNTTEASPTQSNPRATDMVCSSTLLIAYYSRVHIPTPPLLRFCLGYVLPHPMSAFLPSHLSSSSRTMPLNIRSRSEGSPCPGHLLPDIQTRDPFSFIVHSESLFFVQSLHNPVFNNVSRQITLPFNPLASRHNPFASRHNLCNGPFQTKSGAAQRLSRGDRISTRNLTTENR